MSDEIMANEQAATDAPVQTDNQAEAVKTYTQEEFDRHMSGLRKSLESKFEKQFQDLGDLNELKEMKANVEKQRQEEALKKGEFEKVLQEMAAKKDAEIQKRDSIIKEYKVNSPLLDAAARYKAIAPEQVRSLLNNQVVLNDQGEVEVVDAQGITRYADNGAPLTVDDLVKEFLGSNQHFVQAAPSTTATKSSVGVNPTAENFDVSKLDLTNPEHRKLYKQALSQGTVS
jgi:hypothetical protein